MFVWAFNCYGHGGYGRILVFNKKGLALSFFYYLTSPQELV